MGAPDPCALHRAQDCDDFDLRGLREHVERGDGFEAVGGTQFAEIARELGMDRAEIRRRNFIPPDAFPWKNYIIYQDFTPLEYR